MSARTFGRSLWLIIIVTGACWTVVLASSTAQEPGAPAPYQVVSGKIKVNGKSVAPGFDIASGDTVETAKGSSAVVSLGKLGRVEVLPASQMKVSFDASSMTVALDAGSARVTKAEGITATVWTKDGEVVATTPLAASFTVDANCGNTVVTAHDATVELRVSGEVRMIEPGSHASAGKPRAGCKPKPVKRSSTSGQ